MFKFELFQVGGTFKVRGAFSNILALTDSERSAGVTCVSAGNHAIAVAYAAQRMDVGAKVVIVKNASPARVALCRRYGAEVVFAENVAEAFEVVRCVEAEEGRVFIHPFNGYRTVLGTATLGYEWTSQAPDLDAVIVPIGGGGLAAVYRRQCGSPIRRCTFMAWNRPARTRCAAASPRITRSRWARCIASPIR